METSREHMDGAPEKRESTEVRGEQIPPAEAAAGLLTDGDVQEVDAMLLLDGEVERTLLLAVL